MKGFKLFANDLGIDLGTAMTRVADQQGNIMIEEPSVVAIDLKTYEILSVGRDAKKLTGKTTESIVAISPIQNGVITDFEVTLAMLSHFLRKALGSYTLFQPKVWTTVPMALTDVERRSVEDLCLHAGARSCRLVEENMASAVGLGLDLQEARAHMICNIGAGTVEVSVVSLGGVITSQSRKIGGDDVLSNIYQILKRRKKLLIGHQMAEEVLSSLISFDPAKKENQIEVFGRNFVNNRPESILLSSQEIFLAITDLVRTSLEAIRSVLERIPPDVSKDILTEGIFLLGGLAQVDGFADFLQEEINIPVHLAEDPTRVTAKGIGLLSSKIRQKQLII